MKTIRLSIIFVIAFMGFNQTVKAQEEENKLSNKQIYIEIGGPGAGFSVQFDGRFAVNQRTGMGYRVGLGVAPYEDKTDSYSYGKKTSPKTLLTIPMSLNYVLGKESSPHSFEVGGGPTWLSKAVYFGSDDYGKEMPLFGHLEFMYRYVPLSGGFTLRIGFTPIFSMKGEIILYAAVGMGYSF